MVIDLLSEILLYVAFFGFSDLIVKTFFEPVENVKIKHMFIYYLVLLLLGGSGYYYTLSNDT